MRPGLDMGGQNIGSGAGKRLDIGINRGDHQMHIHHPLDMGPDGGTGCRAKGDVGHKMAVHHIDMHPIRALSLNRAAFGAEIGEIRGKDRRGNLDTAIKTHGLSFTGAAAFRP